METRLPGEKPRFDFLIIISYEQKIQRGKINRQQTYDKTEKKIRVNLFLDQAH